MSEIIDLHDSAELQQTADTMEALGNETRLVIFTLLVPAGQSGLTVGEVQARLGVPGSTLSHHIARLVQVGLVQQQRQGRKLICRANYRQMDNVLKFLTRNCCAADGADAGHVHEAAGQQEGSAA